MRIRFFKCHRRLALLMVLCAVALGGGCLYDWPTAGIPRDGAADASGLEDAGDAGDAGPRCGNGRLETGESCDGSQLGGETCATQGFGGGQLLCGSDCTLDTAGCLNQQTCGDGFIGANEECDDGDLVSADGCDATCMVEPGWACSGEPSTCTDGCGNQVCYLAGGESAGSCPADCGWIQLVAGRAHTCGLKANGTVWCWGDNSAGQLGDGTQTDGPEPAAVESLSGITRIAAGGDHSCAIGNAGAVWCWGANGDGQLGNGTIIPSDLPVQAESLFDAVRISAGAAHTCVTTAALEAYCWGLNDDGQLGDGTPVSRQVPTAVAVGAGLTEASAISAGGRHTCALHDNGTLWCWGANNAGQLGTGSAGESLLPVAVDSAGGLTSAVRVSAGWEHTCAVDSLDGPWCWGNGGERRLGNGGSQNELAPDGVIDVGATLDVAAGAAHTCAVAADGILWCFGDGDDGCLGIGSSPPQTNPTALTAPTNSVAVVAGESHGCALDSAGAAWCWGAGTDGQLGNGASTTQDTAVAVTDPY